MFYNNNYEFSKCFSRIRLTNFKYIYIWASGGRFNLFWHSRGGDSTPLQEQSNPELKTLEWDILNHDRLIWLSNVHTFDFILIILFFDISTVQKLRLITITDTMLYRWDKFPFSKTRSLSINLDIHYSNVFSSGNIYFTLFQEEAYLCVDLPLL